MSSKMQAEARYGPVGHPPALDGHQHPPGRPWRASVVRRLPWDALLTFFGAIASAILMVVVILKSNNDPVSNWPVAPAVYLAIVSVVANILLRYAFSRGVELSWWVAAMKDDTKVQDLHNIWLYGTSLRSAFVAGRNFNLVALAAILLALVPANAPLAQRASTTVTRTTTADIAIPLVAAPTIGPWMETGQITGRAHAVSYLTASFAKVLQDHLVSAPITVSQACDSGTCKGVVHAAGFEVSCVSGSQLFDKYPASGNASVIGPDGTTALNDTTIFGTGFNYNEQPVRFEAGKSAMNLTVVFKGDSGCKGALTLRNCTLTPATLEYRVVVANSSIALDSAYTYEDDKVVSYYETPGTTAQQPSFHGGLAMALKSMFTSNVAMSFGGAVGMRIITTGVTGLRFQRAKERESTVEDNACLSYWLDPTHDLLMSVREIAFRLAFQTNVTGVATQEMRAERLLTEVVYQSDYKFLGLALLFIGLSALTVVPLLLKWWRLGREVSLSPIEVARAFGAPELMAGSGSNSSASELMKEVGSREVRYGQVVYGEYGGPTVTALAFAHPTMVQPPQKGTVY